MMTKAQAIRELVDMTAYEAADRARLTAYHNGRSLPAVMESLNRWRAINGTTKEERRRHCQLFGLPRLGK
jgi:hypothetical protein